jgi:hypothetical protein
LSWGLLLALAQAAAKPGGGHSVVTTVQHIDKAKQLYRYHRVHRNPMQAPAAQSSPARPVARWPAARPRSTTGVGAGCRQPLCRDHLTHRRVPSGENRCRLCAVQAVFDSIHNFDYRLLPTLIARPSAKRHTENHASLVISESTAVAAAGSYRNPAGVWPQAT